MLVVNSPSCPICKGRSTVQLKITCCPWKNLKKRQKGFALGNDVKWLEIKFAIKICLPYEIHSPLFTMLWCFFVTKIFLQRNLTFSGNSFDYKWPSGCIVARGVAVGMMLTGCWQLLPSQYVRPRCVDKQKLCHKIIVRGCWYILYRSQIDWAFRKA